MNKLVFSFILIAVLFAGCTETIQQEKTVVLSISAEAHGETILEKQVEMPKGSNAFDAMKENSELEVQEFDFGVMVNGIEGVVAGENEYWALYINGAYAEKGIADYSIEENTQIEWKLESFEAFPLE